MTCIHEREPGHSPGVGGYVYGMGRLKPEETDNFAREYEDDSTGYLFYKPANTRFRHVRRYNEQQYLRGKEGRFEE